MKKKIVNKNVAGMHDSALGRRYLGKPPAYEPEDPDSGEPCHDDYRMGILTEEIRLPQRFKSKGKQSKSIPYYAKFF